MDRTYPCEGYNSGSIPDGFIVSQLHIQASKFIPIEITICDMSTPSIQDWPTSQQASPQASADHYIVVHGAGVHNPGTPTESNTLEWTMRVHGYVAHIEKLLFDVLKWEERSPDRIDRIVVYMSGGKVESNKWQKQSEAHYMKKDFEQQL
jgi:hypothetical protein